MASLTQIAQKAGVSVTAASLVLNKKDHGTRVSEDCAARIRQIAKELGYVPNYHASSIKKGRSESVAVALDIGCVVPDGKGNPAETELQTPYFNLLIGGIEGVMRRKGYLLTLVGPDVNNRAPDRALVGVRQRRFDGMIVLGSLVKVQASTVLQQAPNLPIVVIQPPFATQLAAIDYNENQAAELAVSHLASLGHQKLLWIGEPTYPSTNRQMRIQRYCRERGLGINVLLHQPPLDDRGFLRYHDIPESVRKALLDFLKTNPREFTGVICYNDNVAVGVVDALLDLGLRVPEDVSVIGHDNFEGRRCRPRLTSVDHCLEEMGRRAADLLLEMIEDPSHAASLRGKRDMVEPILVVRASTGPALR